MKAAQLAQFDFMPEPTTPEGHQLLLKLAAEENDHDPLTLHTPIVVQGNALATALLKLGIMDVTATTLALLEVVRRKQAPNLASRKPLLLSTLDLAHTRPGSLPPYKSTTIKNPPPRDAESLERRRLAIAEMKRDFPDLKFPDPYTVVWLNNFENSFRKLPFICASIKITPAEDESEVQTFDDVWCLFDLGAQVSQIPSIHLNASLRGNKMEGMASMEVMFTGTNRVLYSSIAFREHMPNDTNFIILGEHGILERLEYYLQPQLLNRVLRQRNPSAYGQIELVNYADPMNDDLPTPL
jgi:hypothetical protein